MIYWTYLKPPISKFEYLSIFIRKDSNVNRVSHGSITPGRESFRQGRANNGLTTKMNNGSIETGTTVGSGYNPRGKKREVMFKRGSL